MNKKSLIGAIEAGGTKFVCAIGTDIDNIVTTTIPTTTPEETLARVIDFFKNQPKAPEAFGIGSFGPIDNNQGSSAYGYITDPPRSGWSRVNIVGEIQGAFKKPVAFETDVNMAALGEQTYGVARGHNSFVYLTVGTGIGGGVVERGELLEGILHPEIGHMLIPQDRDDSFKGSCRFHGNCLEGLASGSAISKRWKIAGEELPQGHSGWQLEAQYLACATVNLTTVLSPELIILGGSVMLHPGLIAGVRLQTKALLNDYLKLEQLGDKIDSYIVLPQHHNLSGVLGALESGRRLLE